MELEYTSKWNFHAYEKYGYPKADVMKGQLNRGTTRIQVSEFLFDFFFFFVERKYFEKFLHFDILFIFWF